MAIVKWFIVRHLFPNLVAIRSRLLIFVTLHDFYFWQATLKGQYTSRNESMGSEKKCELLQLTLMSYGSAWSHIWTLQAS